MKRFSLILLVLVLILIVPACQKKAENNVLGAWEFTLTSQGSNPEKHMVTFGQTLTTGFWTMDMENNLNIQGTFQVDGDTITMVITKATYENGLTGSFTGVFENDNKMSGDWSVADNGGTPNTGTWTAVKK